MKKTGKMSQSRSVVGVVRSRYVLGDRTTFSYHNTSRCEIIYYKGQQITRVRDEPLHEYVEDVSFVCFDDRESATQVVRCSRHRVNHDRVLQARFYTYDAGLNKHLVCFDRFDGFLPQADPTFLASLEDPNSSYEVPGNPNNIVQREVKELIKALEYMHSKGVSSSVLHLPVGYVWSSGTVKIIMVDGSREDHTGVQLNKILVRDVERFGTGLDKYFLKTTVLWPEKDSFMRCFSMRLQEENRRLPMIHDHPFLKNNITKILQIFPKVHHALRSSDFGELQLTKLMVALNSKQFKSEFMPNGVWTRQEISPEFDAFLRGEPLGNSIKYNTKDMGELLRCLRNLYHHYYKSGMSSRFFFNEVQRYWPHLMDRFHEKIAG